MPLMATTVINVQRLTSPTAIPTRFLYRVVQKWRQCIADRNFVNCWKIFNVSLLESWLNLLQDNVTFSTTPLKCCHFTLQNVKRNKMTNWLYIILLYTV